MIRNHATIKNVSGVILVIGMNAAYTGKLLLKHGGTGKKVDR